MFDVGAGNRFPKSPVPSGCNRVESGIITPELHHPWSLLLDSVSLVDRENPYIYEDEVPIN